MDHLPEGTLAPDFELSTADGSPFRLSEHAGDRPVLLAFYKSACPTCQLTFPFIERLFGGFGPEARPAIWGISQDEAGPTRDFAERFGLGFPVLIDAHPYPVSVDYEVRYVPTVYLIDPGRRIRMADFGFSKPALRSAADAFARSLDRTAPDLFAGDGLPERRPG